jgi:hypothetical protein
MRPGDTSLPRVDDRTMLTPESVYAGTDELGSQLRFASLQAKAYAVARGRHDAEGEGWIIVFRYLDPAYSDRGRVVSINANGDRIRMEHQDIYLNYPALMILNR